MTTEPSPHLDHSPVVNVDSMSNGTVSPQSPKTSDRAILTQIMWNFSMKMDNLSDKKYSLNGSQINVSIMALTALVSHKNAILKDQGEKSSDQFTPVHRRGASRSAPLVTAGHIPQEVFEYTRSCYMSNSLSNHTLIILEFPSSPKPIVMFHYCEMWSKHHDFARIIATPKHS
ncbi:hypothetical protein Cgig2_014399 [Carnegiea gigantea]|uniref:Uncharacterized protein n=1 Tax=Carnegiea gigantea TaxID=171969 RepID=A0A9Q1K175_9CARY|nr:hypothetical protein Cgig2_014399 [Carnegiea gigantea]